MTEFKPGDRVIRTGPDIRMRGADMRQGCVYIVEKTGASGTADSYITVIGVPGTLASKHFVHLLEPELPEPKPEPLETPGAFLSGHEPLGLYLTQVINVAFKQPFLRPPKVMASVVSVDSSVGVRGSLVTTRNITTSGFEALVQCPPGSSFSSYGLEWVAVVVPSNVPGAAFINRRLYSGQTVVDSNGNRFTLRALPNYGS